MQKEIETLKKKIIEEREKLRDKTVVQVAEGIEAVHGLNVKVRRSLKGHNAKVLCLDWSIDKRHLVSSSQVRMNPQSKSPVLHCWGFFYLETVGVR